MLGEAVTPLKRKKILHAVSTFGEVKKIISLKTMHFSPDEVLVTIEINYKDDLVLNELEELNDRIEKKIKEIIPNAKIYLEPENN